jgi:type III secretory pathway component EscV
MPFKKTKRKFKQLSQEPEEVRVRAATRISIVLGIIIIPLVLFVLLPLQIKTQKVRNSTDSEKNTSQNSQFKSNFSQLQQLTNTQADNEETASVGVPQVGGVSKEGKLPLSIPEYTNVDIPQKLMRNDTETLPTKFSPSPEVKAPDTNNVPVEIIP